MDPQLLETAPEAVEAAWSDAQIGRYAFRRLLGSGGMGVVVAAHDPELDREVAIKIVAGDETARPIREAQAMAKLSHPNVVQVYEVIRLGTRTAIVMELVEGEELGAWQKHERSWREIIEAYVQASRGLTAAHRAGIVHRDFKPSNALVDRDGVVRVTDFGLARASSETDEAIAGTPAYMAPEQHRGGAIDARTDQWGLACSLYEALHGKRPFASAESAGLAAAVARGDLEDEPADSPVPRRVRAAIRRALAPDPAVRFATVEDFAAAISTRPRHVPYAVGAIVAIAAIVTIAALATRSEPAVCQGLDEPMRAVWNDGTRAALRGRLLAPGVGLPAPTVDKALRGLDAYATSWTATRTAACLDSQQGVRSEVTLDTRMRCLDHRLAEVLGLLEGLAASNPASLRATSDAVSQLRPAGECSEVTDVTARPTDPIVDAAEDTLARASALLSLGQYERALPLVERVIVTGKQSTAPSLTARALVIRGECEDRLGRHAASLATYRQAAKLAAQAREHAVTADALARAFYVEGDHLGQRAEALRSRPFVELAVESAGQPDAVRSEWLHFLAILLYDDPRHVEEAVAHERESLAIRQRTLPSDHVYIFDSLETLANIEAARKNFDESTTLLERVLAGRIAARGPTDYLVSSAYNNLGVVEIRRDNLTAAIDYLRPAVDIAKAAGQPNSGAEFNLGLSQLELGRWREAAATFAAALATEERIAGPESRAVGEAALFLGVARYFGGDIERARPLLLRAVEVSRRSGSPVLASALTYVAHLALRDGDRARARVLLDEAMKLPTADQGIRFFVGGELARTETGCAAARPQFAKALDFATTEGYRLVKLLATVALAECEIAAGERPAARQRLEAELTALEKAGADEVARARVRAALAKL
jgi:tetratricopeptide (TPR) repeat protein/predicted Ser/Thr protein kinase